MKISLLIATMNRPQELKRNLLSVSSCNPKPYEVIVSDDSCGAVSSEVERVVAEFLDVKYIRGPQKGICANRNNLIRNSSGDFVAFVDDDTILNKDYFKNMADCFVKCSKEQGEKIIVTGREIRDGKEIVPHKLTFLGHQAGTYKNMNNLKTIVQNSTLFPAALFKIIEFDENLHYFREEVDTAHQAVYSGYTIMFCPEVVNNHKRSSINRQITRPFQEEDRIYEMLKVYGIYERKYLKFFIFFIISPFHLFIYHLKRKRFHWPNEVGAALKNYFDFRKRYYAAKKKKFL